MPTDSRMGERNGGTQWEEASTAPAARGHVAWRDVPAAQTAPLGLHGSGIGHALAVRIMVLGPLTGACR
jgi:hypothetical protein